MPRSYGEKTRKQAEYKEGTSKRFNLSKEIVSMLCKTVIVHKVNGNKCTALEKASFPAAKSKGHKFQPYFLTRLSWTSLMEVFFVSQLYSASTIQIEEMTNFMKGTDLDTVSSMKNQSEIQMH